PERGQAAAGLFPQGLGPPAALGAAQKAGEGQLRPGGVLADALADVAGGALDLEQVVGDLEGQAEAPAVAVEPLQHPLGRIDTLRSKVYPSPQADASANQRPRLAQVKVLQVGQRPPARLRRPLPR